MTPDQDLGSHLAFSCQEFLSYGGVGANRLYPGWGLVQAFTSGLASTQALALPVHGGGRLIRGLTLPC